jgi:hypothetical protein
MEEINVQEWDNLQPDPISDKTKIELALIDLYNRLAMQVPTDHQMILDELAQKLLSQEDSLTVKQVDGSFEPSDSGVHETQLRVQANSPYNDGWTRDFYEKELKRYNAGTKEWPTPRTKEEQDYMYNWIREKGGRVKLD